MGKPEGNKDEFEWEQSFRQSDDFARKYFQLLRRYGDLPDGEDLITKKLTKIFGEEFVDAMYGYDDYFSDTDLSPLDNPDLDLDDMEDDMDGQLGAGSGAAPGDDAFDKELTGRPGMESVDRHCHELVVTLTQTAMGWCNLYSCLLTKEHRGDGLRVMFFVSRALANISISLEEMIRWEVSAAVARAKRCLDNVNQAIGLINDMKESNPAIREVMTTIQTQLIKCADDLGEYIRECRALDKDDMPF
ncbi:MAG: hypothetical protein GX945_01355 [Lentisphaerae bacterium]|jgi:hypothetical protein|nr:hypothetical protein [Lentisphaerota bacterium]